MWSTNMSPRILTDNTATRTGQAQDTLQFFTQEVDRLSTDLSTQSAAILDFQNANADALPDTLDYRLTQQSNLQERLAVTERDLTSLRDQRARLVEIYRATGQLEGIQRSPEAAQLAQLQADLSRAPCHLFGHQSQGRAFGKQHRPSCRPASTANPNRNPKSPAPRPPSRPLDIQTAQIDAQMAQLEQQAKDITAELARLKDSIDRTAAVAVQLQALQRDYDNTQVQYATATDRLSKASTGERIEALAKGQRIGVLDAATVPDAPYSPNRVKIVTLGGLAGLVLGFGLILLTELLNSAIRRPTDLERHLQIIPIGVIPYMETPPRNRPAALADRLGADPGGRGPAAGGLGGGPASTCPST